MEINKTIFGDKTIEQIPVPSCRIRVINGQRQIHYFSFEEYKHYFASGELKVLNDAEWTDLPDDPKSTRTQNPRQTKTDGSEELKEGKP